MGIYIIDENSNALIDLSISGNETSISNGDAVTGQYVSGATEANGEITYTRLPLPAGTIDGATDTTFTTLANNDVIQRKSGVFVNRTTDQLLVDLLTGTGNGVLTNTNGILGTTTLPSPPQTGVNPNPTDGRIPLGQGLNADFVDSAIEQTTDTLLTFDATIHHDQGGRDFNIYPTGVLADFIANPTNYNFRVVRSSTTNGREGFTEEIFNSDITRFTTTVQIVNVAAAVAFTQAEIITIRVGTSVPVATGVANIAGLQTWQTGTSNVIFTFDTVENAQLAVAAFSQTQARLTVTSTETVIPVAAYNANGEGMLGAFLDGRLAEGDRVRFTQIAANLETHLRISTDVVNIDEHLIVDGPTNLNGTVSFGGRVTVPEPIDAADAARNDTTWRSAIADSGIRGTTTIQSAGGRTNISVTALSGVENAGGFTNWFIWTGVALNDAEDGFGIAVENVVYSTSGTDPFATGTSTANRPRNIQATADQSFHRDVDIANDLIVRGDATVSGDTTLVDLATTGNIITTGGRDTSQNLFTGFVDGEGARIDSDSTGTLSTIPAGTTYRAYISDYVNNVNSLGGDVIALALPPSGVTIPSAPQILAFNGVPTVNGLTRISIRIGSTTLEDLPVTLTTNAAGADALDGAGLIYLGLTQAQVDSLEAVGDGTANIAGDATGTRLHYTADQIELYASATVPTTGNLTVGGDINSTGNLNDFPVTALEKASLFLGTRGTRTTVSLSVGGVSTSITVTPYTTGTDTRYFYGGIAFNSSNAIVTGRGIWSTSATAPTITNSINLIG